MKKSLVIFLLSCINAVFAQESMQLTLRWNPQLSRYDVFAKPNFTRNEVLIGPTQITIVVPADASNDIFKITSTSIGICIGLSQDKVLTMPISISMVDLHVLYSVGGSKVNFIQNQELLLFGFTFFDNKCREAVRILENEIDPKLMPEEMRQYDFRNSIINPFLLQELYSSNYNNSGTICYDCRDKLIIPYTIKKTLYTSPNNP